MKQPAAAVCGANGRGCVGYLVASSTGFKCIIPQSIVDRIDVPNSIMQDATRFPLLPFVRQAALSPFLPNLGQTPDAKFNEAWLHPPLGLAKVVSKTSLCEKMQKSRRCVDRYLPILANAVVHCDRAWRNSLVQGVARYLIARANRLIDYDIFIGSDETPWKLPSSIGLC